MRKSLLSVVVLMLVAAIGVGNAQSLKEQQKERQELAKASKSELSKKASKEARKEAKRLKKEGWTTAPGALPLDKQLDKSYLIITVR